MITPMSKIELFVLKEDLTPTIEILHSLGLLHIEQAHLSKIMEQRGIKRITLAPGQEKEKAACEFLLREVNELIHALGDLCRSCLLRKSSAECELPAKPFAELTEIITQQLKPRLNAITQEINILKDEFNILPQYKEILESFLVSKKELKIHEGLSCLALIFAQRYEKDMQIFKRHLEEKTKSRLEVYAAALTSKKIVALLFYPPEIAKQIDEEIFKKGTLKIELPSKFLSQPLAETIKFIETRLKEIPQQLERLNKALLEFANQNLSLACAVKAIALNYLDRILVVNNFLSSKYTAAITGWLPKKDLTVLKEKLEDSLGENFAVYDRTHQVKHTQEIPILLENPKGIRPYELLLGLLPLPKYGTMDATRLLSFFFPFFFGLIVGDIGYGLIFLFIALFLKKSAKPIIRSVGSILFAASLSSIFFGILYGELFGNLGKDYFHLPHILFDRHESIIPFLVLAVSVGIFHIALGFLLGIIEAIRKKHKKEIIEKISILAGLVALFLLVGALVKVLPSKVLPSSLVLLIVVTVILIIVRGFLGPLEAVSAVANILSYARLMALGLAGVMMAGMANKIGGLPENIFIGIIIASLLHALNLVLSIFSPTVQSLRLHYVEFFSKFYEPGGKKYNPFRKKEVVECIS